MIDHVSPFNACATCGGSLRDGEWHPVTAEPSDDDRPDLFSFCDEECQAAWLTDPARARGQSLGGATRQRDPDRGADRSEQ